MNIWTKVVIFFFFQKVPNLHEQRVHGRNPKKPRDRKNKQHPNRSPILEQQAHRLHTNGDRTFTKHHAIRRKQELPHRPNPLLLRLLSQNGASQLRRQPLVRRRSRGHLQITKAPKPHPPQQLLHPTRPRLPELDLEEGSRRFWKLHYGSAGAEIGGGMHPFLHQCSELSRWEVDEVHPLYGELVLEWRSGSRTPSAGEKDDGDENVCGSCSPLNLHLFLFYVYSISVYGTQ